MTWIKRIGFFLLLLLALKGLGVLLVDGGAERDSIAVVDVTGTIWTSDEHLEELRQLRKDSNVRGVVVRVNSPGGTVAASQEIFEALKTLKEKKPVVISMGTVAASGGLYISMGADNIMADAGTITGSIGVRMEHMHFEDLLSWLKVGTETLQSGRLKSLVSYDRPISKEGRDILLEMLSEVHDQFKEAIQTSRNLKPEAVELWADGRIFTGAKAKELGLVDRLGNLDAAIAWAADLAGLRKEPNVFKSEEENFWWWKNLNTTMKAFVSGPKICYLYR